MLETLNKKRIILAVTGSIAAYKSAELTRQLIAEGTEVQVVMTNAAKEFITALTMQAVSGRRVRDDQFDVTAEAGMSHIELARWADMILIAPASADVIARLAGGEANDLLTTICLATKAPIVLAPAMNQQMWHAKITQTNLQKIMAQKYTILGPGMGSQACGDEGLGRMLEPHEIVSQVAQLFSKGQLAKQRVLITAGPTREAIDPVRYITNKSSGKMGYALAEAARNAGARVTLISGPVFLPKPRGMDVISVESAQQMFEAVHHHITDQHLFISAAAVADYFSKDVSSKKLVKQADQLTLILHKTTDIISSVTAMKHKLFAIGFAAQTHDVVTYAREKLQSKKLNMIIANDVSQPNIGFDNDENAVSVLWDNQQKDFARMSKTRLAEQLIELIAEVYHASAN